MNLDYINALQNCVTIKYHLNISYKDIHDNELNLTFVLLLH